MELVDTTADVSDADIKDWGLASLTQAIRGRTCVAYYDHNKDETGGFRVEISYAAARAAAQKAAADRKATAHDAHGNPYHVPLWVRG